MNRQRNNHHRPLSQQDDQEPEPHESSTLPLSTLTTHTVHNINNPINNNQQQDSCNSNKSILARLVTVTAATAATLGYDVGIMAAAIQLLEKDFTLTAVQKEVAMGSLNFFAAAGALLGGRIADRRGRKPTICVCGWLFVMGTLCMATAINYSMLLVGRIITGLGVGVSFVVAPVFISEVAPTNQRGQLNTVFDVAINGGILFGYIVGYLIMELMPAATSNSLKWRLMLGAGIVLPIIVLLLLHSLPESPRWLVVVEQTQMARESLLCLGASQEEATATITAIQDELQEEHEYEEEQQDKQQFATTSHSTNSKHYWCSRLPSSGIRRAMGLGFWQQCTGTEAVLYYSADFLASAGLTSPQGRLLGNVFVGLSKLFPELFAMRVVDRLGRRPLILASSLLLTLSTASLALAFSLQASPMLVVLLLCAIMASFSIGLGPFTFLVASENLGLSERAWGMTMCATLNRCTSGVVALSAVSLYNTFGDSGFFAFYAGVGMISMGFYYTAVTETSGQTLEELAARARGGSDHKHHHPRHQVGYDQCEEVYLGSRLKMRSGSEHDNDNGGDDDELELQTAENSPSMLMHRHHIIT